MFINIPPLTKYICELTEYQILIFGVQPNIELFGEYIWSNRILNYSVATLNFIHLRAMQLFSTLFRSGLPTADPAYSVDP